MKQWKCCYSDHESLHVGERGQIKQVLDEVWRARLSQPQEHGVAVLQQEYSRIDQTLLWTAQWSGQSLAANVQVVLKERRNFLLFKNHVWDEYLKSVS